jgi:hypothetical protein
MASVIIGSSFSHDRQTQRPVSRRGRPNGRHRNRSAFAGVAADCATAFALGAASWRTDAAGSIPQDPGTDAGLGYPGGSLKRDRSANRAEACSDCGHAGSRAGLSVHRLACGLARRRAHAAMAGVVRTAVATSSGVEYAGKTYRSLSDVARTITGTRWSGPRFFGLEQKCSPGKPKP